MALGGGIDIVGEPAFLSCVRSKWITSIRDLASTAPVTRQPEQLPLRRRIRFASAARRRCRRRRSCSASPTEVWPGDPVKATIATQNFNPKHTLTYKWAAPAARSGTGTARNCGYHRPERRAATRSRRLSPMPRRRRTTSQPACGIHRQARPTPADGELLGEPDERSPSASCDHHHDRQQIRRDGR